MSIAALRDNGDDEWGVDLAGGGVVERVTVFLESGVPPDLPEILMDLTDHLGAFERGGGSFAGWVAADGADWRTEGDLASLHHVFRIVAANRVALVRLLGAAGYRELVEDVKWGSEVQ